MGKRLGLIVTASVCLILLLLPARAAFSDVRPGEWCEGAVTEMVRAGAVSGYPDGSFRPDRPMTAAEFVSVTARLAGLSPVPGRCDHWAAGYTQAALQAGWYDWDELPPTGERFDLPITRQLAVKILMRAFLPGVRGDYNTESAKISDFSALDGRYYEPVLAAYAAGVVRGDPNGTFHPQGSLSRAEACVLFQTAAGKGGGAGSGPEDPGPALPEPVPQPVRARQGGVAQNGWLQVEGTRLCNERGEPVVLRGMSSHGLQWYGRFASAEAIAATGDWGANVFRIAMYTGEGGYLSRPEDIRAQAVAAVDAAIANDMYVIIDWHILSDGNPMDHVEEAAAFFDDMARRYQDSPAVLYEICNEPNGGANWAGDIKPYARRIIGTIRAHSPKAVILVGSSTWSQDIHLAAADPVEGENLMYTLHFYAGTHGRELQERLECALARGLPVFVSEWGTSRADGGGGVFPEESEVWLDLLERYGISWCGWSLCDKDEASAALRPGVSPDGPWALSDLTPSGQFMFSHFTG